MKQPDTDVDLAALRQRVSRRDENARAAMQVILEREYDNLPGAAIAAAAYMFADHMERARNEVVPE